MRIGVARETAAGERRVSLVPDGVARLRAAGEEVLVQSGAGEGAYIPDDAYREAGAAVTDAATVFSADVVLQIRPEAAGIPGHSWPGAGAVLVGLLSPLTRADLTRKAAATGVTAFSLDAMPRISRAQGMDVLTSMSTIAGYYAVVWAAAHLPRLFPLLMTAAGTLAPARVLVLGAGVAGLEAVGMAHRLGAVVEAFDTRPAVREQVESLGGRFLGLEVRSGETGEGYARQLEEETHARELELLGPPVAAADVVITTALVPGRRAPLLVTDLMVASMRPGSVIVDLAAEAGGNCSATVPGETAVRNAVTVHAPLNVPSLIPVHASQLYSRNVVTFLQHLLRLGLVRPVSPAPPQWQEGDEILARTCVAHAGAVRHPAVRAAAAKGDD